MEYLVKTHLNNEVKILTPENPTQRGSHLSMSFNAVRNGHVVTADEVLELLRQHGVFADVRKPNVIRITPAPLYNNFEDVYNFIQILISILRE